MNETQSAVWRIWVDTENRIVSFHEAEGCQLMEFHNREMFLSYIDGFTNKGQCRTLFHCRFQMVYAERRHIL